MGAPTLADLRITRDTLIALAEVDGNDAAASLKMIVALEIGHLVREREDEQAVQERRRQWALSARANLGRRG